MVKNRAHYFYCTNEACKKGKGRAIRKSNWKSNHLCGFEIYSKYAYGPD